MEKTKKVKRKNKIPKPRKTSQKPAVCPDCGKTYTVSQAIHGQFCSANDEHCDVCGENGMQRICDFCGEMCCEFCADDHCEEYKN